MKTKVQSRPLHWSQGIWAALDFETTGPDPFTDRPVQVAFVLYDNVGVFASTGSWQCIVDPGIPVSEGAAEVHGITDERIKDEGVQEQWALTELLFRLNAVHTLGIPLVIFNAPFDWTMLHTRVDALYQETKSAFSLGGSTIPPLNIIDPLVIDKQEKRYRKAGERKLEALMRLHGVHNPGSHDAWFDCLGACGVLRHQVRVNKLVRSMSLEGLQTAQKNWHKKWADDYNKWCIKNGKSTIDTNWPIINPKERST